MQRREHRHSRATTILHAIETRKASANSIKIIHRTTGSLRIEILIASNTKALIALRLEQIPIIPLLAILIISHIHAKQGLYDLLIVGLKASAEEAARSQHKVVGTKAYIAVI